MRLHSVHFNDGVLSGAVIRSEILPPGVLLRGLWIMASQGSPFASDASGTVEVGVRAAFAVPDAAPVFAANSEGSLLQYPALFRGAVFTGIGSVINAIYLGAPKTGAFSHYLRVGVRPSRSGVWLISVGTGIGQDRGINLNLAFDFDHPFSLEF